jgi:hypothetical protein
VKESPSPDGVGRSAGETVSSAVSEVQASGVGLDDLLGGLVGALLAVFFTTVLTEIREARQRVRESAGLARLLIHEVERNEDAVEIHPPPEPGEREVVMSYRRNIPAVDGWLESRGRLAQLIDREDFGVIADYYEVLRSLRDVLEPYPVHSPDLKTDWEFPGNEPGWAQPTEDVKRRLTNYAYPGWRKNFIGF